MNRPATIISLVILIAPYGCGGSGGKAGASWLAAGRVALPAGTAVPLDSLRVLTGRQSAKVAADGAFSLRVESTSTAHLTVVEASGKPVLTGFADPGPNAQNIQLGTRSSAEAMLFVVLGGFELPATEHAHLRQLIAASPEVGNLAAALDSRIASSLTAVVDGDPQIDSAMQQALDSLGSGRAPARPKTVSAIRSDLPLATAKITATKSNRAGGRAGSFVIYTVQPPPEKSGVTVGPNPDGQGIIIGNSLRRNLKAFFYITGYQDAQGNDHLGTRDPAHTPVFVPAINGLSGTFGSVFDVMIGNVPYAPLFSSPVDLAFNPPDANKVYYEISVVGDGQDCQLPNINLTPELAAREQMQWLTLAKDLFLPLLATFLNTTELNVLRLLNSNNLLAATDDLVVILQSVVDAGTQLSNSNVKGVLVALVKALVNNSTFRQSVINWVTKWLVANSADFVEQVISQSIGGLATAASYYIAVVDKFLNLFDASLIVNHWASSNWFESWQATGVIATVRLQPEDAQVVPGQKVSLICSIPFSGPKEFLWKTSAREGTIEDANHHGATAFTSTSNTIAYKANTTAKVGNTDTVTVDVFAIEGTNRIPIGQAAALVHIVDQTHPAPGVAVVSAAADTSLPDFVKQRVTSFQGTQTALLQWAPGPSRQIVGAIFTDSTGLNSLTMNMVAQPSFAAGQQYSFGPGAGGLLNAAKLQFGVHNFTITGGSGTITITAFDGVNLSFTVDGHLRYTANAPNDNSGVSISASGTIQLGGP